MDRTGFTAWLERYFAAWRSNDPTEVGALFTEDAVYASGPFSGSATGRPSDGLRTLFDEIMSTRASSCASNESGTCTAI